MSPGLKFLVPLLVGLALVHPARAQQSSLDFLGTNAPAASAPVAKASASSGNPGFQADAIKVMKGQAFQFMQQQQLDAALDKVNSVIQIAPQDPDAYALRGSIYTEKKQWDLAEKDYQTVLTIDSKNGPAKFNLAEIKFQQKQYDAARPSFVGLTKDSDLGDLASYKVFLCDLYGGHEDLAASELKAFEAGGNASYYFGNAAWSLFHHKTEEGRVWLISAVQIFKAEKVNLYATTLKNLGYLPLPPPPPRI